MQLKEKKAKRKINKTSVAAIIVSVITLLGLTCVCAGIGVIIYLLRDKPDLNLNDFNSVESTIVYDNEDNQIYELGTVLRQNVEYDDLPNSLVDAFVAVEDSRFFEHAGFDIPRFAKAFLSNIKTMSFSQGGSTFTMQLVKNTYFTSDEEGTGAAKSIKRKVQEIALALQLEKSSSKKQIFTNYLNKLNFGGTNQNIRGVQKASQYYFGKDVNKLNLEESAMLAGVVNSPYLFNPFNYLEYAQERRDEVLYLMNYHGYISDDEYKLALGTRVEDFLKDSNTNERGSGNGTPYQAYIDYVVEEAFNVTGLDPYTTPMRIHTFMDKDVQTLMDNIQAGNVDDYFEYPDDEFEVASICIDNDTGEIIGILGGRNYADGGALLLNHATDQYKQPGSSIKPILDYVQAFEVLGWSTSHCVIDKPLTYLGTDYIISNATNSYGGELSLKYAVGMSLNTPAIQTIRELIDKKGNSYLVDYMTSMGYDIDLNDFDEQYGIGGKGLNVSCLQMAGAYAAIMNGGYYTKPHTISKIEFLNEKAPITPSYNSTQTVSEQSCFLLSELLKNDVEGGYANLMGLFRSDDYTVYAKTGTTNWGTEGKQFNIPNGSIKDGWVVACTSDFSVATWMGYEKGQVGKPSYMTYDIYNKNIKGKISKLILEKTAEKFGFASDIAKPSGIKSITHIAKVGTPYVAPIEGMDSKYITTGYINSSSKLASLSSPQSATVKELESSPKAELKGTELTIEWPTYPDESLLSVASDDIDISLKKSDGSVLLAYSGNRLFDYTWAFGAIKYKADITVKNGNSVVVTKSVTNGDNKATISLQDSLASGYKISACAYYGYENANVNSASKCIDVDVKSTMQVHIPNTLNVDEMITQLRNEGFSVIVTELPEDSGHANGTWTLYRLEPDRKEVNTSLYGSNIDVDSFKFKGFEVYKYVEGEKSISLSSNFDTSEITYDKTVNIEAHLMNINASDIVWYNGDTQIESGTDRLTLTFTSDDIGKTYEISAMFNSTISTNSIVFKIVDTSE